MIQQFSVSNFTVFPETNLKFSPELNVIVGENGSGKTHILKLLYCLCAVQYEEQRRGKEPTKASLQLRLAEKLVGVFRPESLGRLARRRQGRERSELVIQFSARSHNLGFSFSTNSKTEVVVQQLPSGYSGAAPVYLPTRELLTIYPGFLPLYDGHFLDFEETWRDTCVQLGFPLQRGPRLQEITDMLKPLEESLEGTVELDNKSGRFYLKTADGRLEMPLVAEGLRKIAMLARLVATGSLLNKGYLFWDEPEANLNPKLIRVVAKALLRLSQKGLQIFIGSHSLFLVREIELLRHQSDFCKVQCQFFGLSRTADGTVVEQGTSVEDTGPLVALEEELKLKLPTVKSSLNWFNCHQSRLVDCS